jgi:hypothetical protein
LGWKKYELQILNLEEELWNMELPKTKLEVEKKVKEYHIYHLQY